jgi:hypothetical protein
VAGAKLAYIDAMRIDATTLAVEGLRYAAPAAVGGENEVVLGRSGGVTGFYESAPTGHGVEAKAQRLELKRASWRIGQGGVSVESATRLERVDLALAIPAGDAKTTVRVAAESIALEKLRYVSGDLTLDATVALEGAIVERDRAGKLTVVAVTAELRGVALQSGSVALRVARAKIRKLALVSEGDGLRLAAEGLELEDVTIDAGDVQLRAARLEVPRGISWQDGLVEIADLALAGLDVAYAFARPAPDDPPELAAEPPPGPAKKLPDLAALDQLDGHVTADIRIHATLPLLKERGATHALRVPIDRGAISFGELEDGFSAVADALLDFELEGDTLKLELDVIPIVKFDNITLLSWKLVEPVDRELAAQKSIRLRRLLQFDRPSSKEEKPAKRHDKGSIRLLGIDIAPLAVQLSARAPVTIPLGGGTICLDDGDGHAVEALELGGAVHVAVEGESKPGELHASVKGVVASLEQVKLGPAKIASATVDLPSVDSLHVIFDGATPTKITGVVPSLRLRGVRARLGASES